MDEIYKALTDKIKESGGAYGVYYEGELSDVFPDDKRDRSELLKALKVLSDGGYIDVRYAHGNAFCIAFLKDFEMKKESAPVLSDDSKKYEYKPSVKALLSLCAAAFSGGLLSGAICFIAGALL